jgi:hypothetical protein
VFPDEPPVVMAGGLENSPQASGRFFCKKAGRVARPQPSVTRLSAAFLTFPSSLRTPPSCHLNAARMFGLESKGHLGPGADADVAIINPAQRKPTWVFANGQVVVRSGTVVGRGGRLATTPRGIPFLESEGIDCVTASPGWI